MVLTTPSFRWPGIRHPWPWAEIFLSLAITLSTRSFHALFSVPPENAYLIFKYAVVAQAPLAVVACWILARDVSGSLYSATLAAIFVVFSPIFILYGGQVMTDVPSVLFLAVALIIHLRGIQQGRPSLLMIGAALVGLGVNLRETMGFYALWLALAPFVLGWKLRRRELALVGISLSYFLCWPWVGLATGS